MRSLQTMLTLVAVSCSAPPAVAAATPKLVTATYLGTPGDDDLQDAAIADDGTICVAGNVDRPLAPLSGGTKAVTLGEPVKGTWYRAGLVAAFNADGTKLLRVAQFARGQVFLTTVLPAGDGVYVGGYAVREAAAMFEPLGGLFPDPERANAVPLENPLPGEPNPPPNSLPSRPEVDPSGKHEVLTIKTRHHGDKDGVPFVARLSRDLGTIEAATFLEGHHYAWNIAMPLYEEEWTPVGIVAVRGGDLVVLHDGGAPVHHYYGPDYVSRLSPDLKERTWRFDVWHPEIQPIDKIRRRREEFREWKYPILGQIRTLRMRGDEQGNVYLGGWSVSMTSNEPWWCPFLWKLDPRGNVGWKAYSFDPMGGPDGRMGGLVSDSAIRAMAIGDGGDLLVSGISDGGNTVLRRDPRDYSKSGPEFRRGLGGMKGRELYVGHLMRLDAKTRELRAGTMLGSYADRGYEPAWAVDVAGLPGRRILAVGRHSRNHAATPDAWFDAKTDRGMFLSVFADDFEKLFSTNVPDAIPYAVARRGPRCVIVGMAASGRTPSVKPLFAKHAGNLDGYLMVADF